MESVSKGRVSAIRPSRDWIVPLVRDELWCACEWQGLCSRFAAQCTDLCSGHGVIEHGQCRCQEGWHGVECQLMLNQCEVANCNSRGSCVAGECICQSGYQGKFCEQGRVGAFGWILCFMRSLSLSLCYLVACQDFNCSHHGICVEGKCRCFHGYTNDDCSILVHSQCDNRCSGHGKYVDYPTSMCICENDWAGSNCSERK